MKKLLIIAALTFSLQTFCMMDYLASWLPCTSSCTHCCDKSYLDTLKSELPEITDFYNEEDLQKAVDSARSARKDGHIAVSSRAKSSNELITSMQRAHKTSYDFQKREIQHDRVKSCLLATSIIIISFGNLGYLIYNLVDSDEKAGNKAALAITGGGGIVASFFASVKLFYDAWRCPALVQLKNGREINTVHTKIHDKILKNEDRLIEALALEQGNRPNRPIHGVNRPVSVNLGYTGEPASGSHILRAGTSVVPVLSFAHDDSGSPTSTRSTPPELQKTSSHQPPPPPTNRTLQRVSSAPDLVAYSHRDTTRAALAAAAATLAKPAPGRSSHGTSSPELSEVEAGKSKRVSLVVDGVVMQALLLQAPDSSSSSSSMSAAAAAAAGSRPDE